MYCHAPKEQKCMIIYYKLPRTTSGLKQGFKKKLTKLPYFFFSLNTTTEAINPKENKVNSIEF